jgi:WD40 repeat protein
MRGVGERMSALALSPDGRTLAAGDAGGNLFLFDTRTRRRVTAPDVQAGDWAIAQLVYSSDGRRLAIAHDAPDGDVVTVMDTRTRRLGRPMPLYDFERAVTALRFEGEAAVDVASRPAERGTLERSLLVERFDVRSGRRILGPITLGPPQNAALLGTRGGRRVLTVSGNRLVLRDARTLEPLRAVGIPLPREGALALSPNDRTAAFGDEHGSVRFVDLRSGTVRSASGRHRGAVTAARFTPNGRSLVTTSDDGDAILWDVRSGNAVETLHGHANGIATLQISPDGRTLFTAGLDGAIFIWDLSGAQRLGRPIEAGGPNRNVSALSTDGRRLAVGHPDGTISVVDADRPGRHRTLSVVPDRGEVAGIRFVPGGRLAVVLGPNELVELVDTDTGRTRRIRSGPGDDPDYFTPAVSADGRRLAVPQDTGGGNMIQVAMWALPSLRPIGEPLTVDREIHDLQLSPDGRLFTVVLDNPGLVGGAVETWDVRTRRRVRALQFPKTPSIARFSPDGTLFAVGNGAGQTRAYKTATFKPLTPVLAGEAGGIVGAAITPDNRTLATGSATGAVQLWDVRSGQALGAPLPGVPSSGVIPAFAPDGSHLVATYASGRAYVWDIRSSSLVRQACRVAGRRLTRAEWAEFLPGRAYDPAC